MGWFGILKKIPEPLSNPKTIPYNPKDLYGSKQNLEEPKSAWENPPQVSTQQEVGESGANVPKASVSGQKQGVKHLETMLSASEKELQEEEQDMHMAGAGKERVEGQQSIKDWENPQQETNLAQAPDNFSDDSDVYNTTEKVSEYKNRLMRPARGHKANEVAQLLDMATEAFIDTTNRNKILTRIWEFAAKVKV